MNANLKIRKLNDWYRPNADCVSF